MRARFFLAVALLSPALAQAQIAAGPVLGTEYGFGALVRAGGPRLHVEAGAGIAPLIVYVTYGAGNIFHVYLPGTVGAKVGFGLRSPEDGGMFEIELGASYNNLLRLGLGGGVTSRRPNSRLLFSAGLMIYPDAKDRIRQRLNRDEGLNITDSEFQSPLTFLQPYVSLAIMLGR